MENETFTHIPLKLKITDIQHFFTHDLMLKFYENLSIKRSYAKLVLSTGQTPSISIILLFPFNRWLSCGKKQRL